MSAIDLDPTSSWLAMGTRALGSEPWLLSDEKEVDELQLRSELIAQRRSEVLCGPASAADAIAETLALVEAAGRSLEAGRTIDNGEESLARLGRSITEDVCILQRGPVEWEFEAAVLCFPSRWRLADRVGRPLREVHGPTTGFDPVLADRITSLLDRLGDRVVRRRNWFIHPDPALFQPDRPGAEPVVPVDQVLDDLYVRSERQTLRALPMSGRVVFTIKTQQCTLGEFVADRDRRQRFSAYVADAPVDQTEHRGLSSDQREVLLAALNSDG